MLKLLAIGTLAYVGYRYYQANADARSGGQVGIGHAPAAGGPISTHASLQRDPNRPPTDDPYTGSKLR